MSKTWQLGNFLEDYYEARETDELIENAYEHAYRVQCQRELALWERRKNSDNKAAPPA